MVIPQVEAIVDKAMAHLEAYVHFNGSDANTVEKRQSSSYWYENIPHRGISAFGPQGYAVYRNVKDFGAKGDPLSFSRRIQMLTIFNIGDGVTDDTAAINAASM